MHWFLLAGCCGLTLISISEAENKTKWFIKQTPRFYGARTGSTVHIFCQVYGKEPDLWQWYWSTKYNGTAGPLQDHRLVNTRFDGGRLEMVKLRVADSGVYFCEADGRRGPGTWVEVARNITLRDALYRTNLKDGLIIFQGLLLAVCVAAVFLRKRDMFELKDSDYEEPETDHIYEGLAIETCGGGGLYEELSVYAQADGAEAPWE